MRIAHAARALRAAAGMSAAVILTAMAPAAAQDADAADEALKKGDLTEAKAQFAQAVKRNPADYDAALSYALTLPPKEALKLADSLSRAQNAPGWVKARGLRFSADLLFFTEDYKKAADTYLQASKSDSSSTYRHLYALSTAMDGQTETARAIWNEIAADKTDELSGEAARLSALLPAPPVGAIKVDTVKVPAPTPATPANPPTAPANQQPTASTISAVTVDPAKTPPTPVAPTGQPNNTQVSAPKAPVSAKPAEALFTIQVGAFASKENADNLVKRLAGKYGDITVSTAASGDQTLYRVRVGTFQRKEEAMAFADKLIVEAGLSARVTEK